MNHNSEATKQLGRAIGEALRRGARVADRTFDGIYPPEIERLSGRHWTPVEVAVRAAMFLAHRHDDDNDDDDTIDRQLAAGRILDVGAGVGKFCIVAAAVTAAGGARAPIRVRGVEHRAALVKIAQDAAHRVGVNIEMTHGTLAGEDPSAVDGVYFFNPFEENLCAATCDMIDESVELSVARFERDVEVAECFLRGMRVGTRVATFCGFGGQIPDGYDLVNDLVNEPLEGRQQGLELWEKLEQLEETTGKKQIARWQRRSLVSTTFAARRSMVWDGNEDEAC